MLDQGDIPEVEESIWHIYGFIHVYSLLAKSTVVM